MKRKTKKIIIGAAIAAATVAIGKLYHTSAKHFVGMALDRKIPKSAKNAPSKLMGSKDLSDILNVISQASEKLRCQSFETVEIKSHDGLKLVGHWHACENPKRVIIAMHGWRSTWSRDFGGISGFWQENDSCVLYVEQRGQGESDGEYMGFGLLERYDCLEWIHYVNERTDGRLPIYLAGLSMGATTVLMCAGFDLPRTVHGIMADCGFTSPHAIWKHVAESNLHIPYGLYDAVASDMCRKKIQVGSKDYSCVDAMKQCKVPVLFIHGTDDHFVPIEMTYENYKACAAPKRLLVVPGAEHGMSYLVDQQGYETAVKSFWREFDQ